MKLIKTEEAVGQVLCHDITQIIKGVTKDAVFRKGHIITEEDIPILLRVGKDQIYIWENDETKMHENEAADVLREICQGMNMHPTAVKEGKIELIADCDGLFTIDSKTLKNINSLDEIMIATRRKGIVKKGDKLLGTRVIPLVIDKEKMETCKKVAGDKPITNVIPFKKKKIGLITTGNEVYYGRIQDTFSPVIKEKFKEYDSEVVSHIVLNDDHEKITRAIQSMLDEGVDMVVCTGGMSVDPDDKTPLAIKNSGANIISYGAPVLPGAMFLVSYMDDGRPVIGLPGCVMYARRTIFDLCLPYLMSDTPITKDILVNFGEGGLCLNCKNCVFPH